MVTRRLSTLALVGLSAFGAAGCDSGFSKVSAAEVEPEPEPSNMNDASSADADAGWVLPAADAEVDEDGG